MISSKYRAFSYIALILGIFGFFVFGLAFGFNKIAFFDVIKTLFGFGTQTQEFVVLEIRLPRILIVFVLGMALALSGTILQTLTRNDLADPGIIGINAGAGLGVALVYFVFNLELANIVYLLPISAFLGALITFLGTIYFARDNNGVNMNKLILLGVGTAMALNGAMIILISSADYWKVDFVYQWLSGDIWGDKIIFVYITSPVILFFTILAFMKTQTLNILSLDDISAQSLGVDLNKERLYLVVIAVGLAAVGVSVGGSISFVGLLIPHLAKKIYGANHKHFMLASMLLGGLFLLLADAIGKRILQPEGVVPGIIVALIGAPYFIYLLIRSKN